MARNVVPFKKWHYEWLGPAAEGAAVPVVPDEVLESMERGDSWTGVVDGDIVACAGTVQQWPGRYVAWAYLGLNSGPHMRWITRETDKHLSKMKGRIELTVREDFDAGHRWAKLLGFEVETPRLRRYGPAGENHVGYVRVNE